MKVVSHRAAFVLLVERHVNTTHRAVGAFPDPFAFVIGGSGDASQKGSKD
jgi:hypothetical protein